MKRFLMLAAGALLAHALYAADLTGKWVATVTGNNGQTTETDIYLQAAGDTFTGYMWSARQGNRAIVDGKVAGDQLTFVVVTEVNGEARRQDYTGSITADGLLIHQPFGGRRGGPPAGAPPAGTPPAGAPGAAAGAAARGGAGR